MRIVVTGSDGYIGSNLCKSLRNDRHDVLGLDKATGDNLNSPKIPDRIRKFRPDWIIHLAALPAIIACEENKEQATYDNVKTTEIVSEIGLELDCPIMFSSSQASKNPESSHYAWCKKESEDTLKLVNGGYILRFSNIYGGDRYLEKKSSVMANFGNAFLSGKPLVLNGDGSQGRDFLHMDDLAQVMTDLMNFQPTRMYSLDVGTGISTPLLDVAEIFGCEYTLNPDSSTIGLESNFADTGMMEKLIGYHPRPRMEEWIKEIKCQK